MGLTRFNPSNRVKILSVNTHLTYPGWSEGKLNLAFMDLAKTFLVERGHEVAETFVERGDILPDYGVFDIFKNPDIPARA